MRGEGGGARRRDITNCAAAERHLGPKHPDVAVSNQRGGLAERRISGGQPGDAVRDRLINLRRRQHRAREPYLDAGDLHTAGGRFDGSIELPRTSAASRRTEVGSSDSAEGSLETIERQRRR